MGWLLAGIGALVGIVSHDKKYKQAQAQADDQIAEYERQREQKLETLDLQFDIAAEEANKKADRSDDQMNLAELFTAENFNNQFDALRLGQEADALGWNVQAMQNASQEGNELSNMAASGARSSSMETAVDLEASVNAQTLQLQEDQQRAQEQIGLSNLFGNLAENTANIQNTRTDAMDLRNSYLEGGNQWKLYQNNRNNLNADYDAAIKSINKDKKRAKDNYFSGMLSSMFGGATTGYKVGSQASNYISNWGNLGGKE